MSQAARQALVDNPKLLFQNESQRTDLLDPNLTSTYLIALMQQLVATCPTTILITAVRSDHHDDGPHGHAGGYCIDAWSGDWMSKGDQSTTGLMQAAADSEYCWSVGLAGQALGWSDDIHWPPSPFYWFDDEGADHVHIAAMSQSGGPGIR